MKSRTPKVLHKVCGVEMVQRVLNACPAQCSPIVVVGHGEGNRWLRLWKSPRQW